MSRITIRGVEVSYILMNWSVGKHTIVLTPGGQGGIDEAGMQSRVSYGDLEAALIRHVLSLLQLDAAS